MADTASTPVQRVMSALAAHEVASLAYDVSNAATMEAAYVAKVQLDSSLRDYANYILEATTLFQSFDISPLHDGLYADEEDFDDGELEFAGAPDSEVVHATHCAVVTYVLWRAEEELSLPAILDEVAQHVDLTELWSRVGFEVVSVELEMDVLPDEAGRTFG